MRWKLTNGTYVQIFARDVGTAVSLFFFFFVPIIPLIASHYSHHYHCCELECPRGCRYHGP